MPKSHYLERVSAITDGLERRTKGIRRDFNFGSMLMLLGSANIFTGGFYRLPLYFGADKDEIAVWATITLVASCVLFVGGAYRCFSAYTDFRIDLAMTERNLRLADEDRPCD